MSDEPKEQPKIFLKFKEGQPAADVHPKTGKPLPAPSKVEIANGPFHRTFTTSEQPFAVKDETEKQWLMNTGMFEVAEVADQQTVDSNQVPGEPPEIEPKVQSHRGAKSKAKGDDAAPTPPPAE